MRSLFWPRCRAMLSVVFDGHSADPRANSKPLTVDCAPKSCTVTRNTYHEADTWSMEFEARVLPFDPEAIASCAVRIYMWDSRGDEDVEWHVDGFEMLRGLADEIKFTAGSSNRMVTMSGRDYTAVLDGEWDPKKQIPAGVPLDEAVQAIADDAAPESSSARFLIDFEATDDAGKPIKPPIVGAARRSTKKKGLWVKPGKTHWEVIYEMVISDGFIVFVRDSTIVIANPRTQTKRSLADAPRIIYGRNLVEMTASRKLAKERVPRIIIVYWDAKTRQKFEVAYPTTTDLAEAKRQITTGLGLKKNEDMRLPAPKGVHDRDTAFRYARMRWDLMARAESEYSVKTRCMTVDAGDAAQLLDEQLGGGFNVEFNMMGLVAGDAIGIGFDPFNRELLRTLSIPERVEAIEAQGYQPAIANFVAQNLDRIDQFRQPYYVKKAEYVFDVEDGLEITVDGANYANERRELAWADGTLPDAISGVGKANPLLDVLE